jgi:dipeptidyl aminopeptidase/acylaminoacyl peptidase
MRRAADGSQDELVTAPWSARTRVHEYGGLSYLPVQAAAGGWEIVFANYADQRLYLTQATAVPAAPDPGHRDAANEDAAEDAPGATAADGTAADGMAADSTADDGPNEPAGLDPATGSDVSPGAGVAAGTAAALEDDAAPGIDAVSAADAAAAADAVAVAGDAAPEAAAGAAAASTDSTDGDGRAADAADAADDNGSDGHQDADVAGPRPLTPAPAEPAALRYADFVLSPDRTEVWCVRERHAAGRVTRAIVAVPLDGSAANDPAAVRDLVTGADFYAFPTPSPDGTRLAWISWNHPRMPWDGTELRVASVENGVPGKGILLKGGVAESVLGPSWRDSSSLYVVSDWSGWWNIYQISLVGEPHQALYPAEEEFAGALWELGRRSYAVLADGRLVVTHGQGDVRLAILDPDTCELTDLDIGFDSVGPWLAADGTVAVAVAGGPATPSCLVRVDVADGSAQPLRCELDEVPDPAYLPVPRPMALEGPFGRRVHALVYPPSNPAAAAPAGELPPYVVWVHGGPTGNVLSMLDLEKAFFTSRGIGIIDVDYGGSTGYGRAYRERLRRQWGVVDVEDAIAAARGLVAVGEADPQRLAVRGCSAGGWTALCAMTTGAAAHGTVFSAATSYFGPSNLAEFARDTHDFESRYLDGLVGPLPGFVAAYRERSPGGNVTAATSPILVLQGLQDPVVPPEQAESIVRELAEHGIRHAYLAFDGESHGFRRAETVIAAAEAELSFYGQIMGFAPPGIPVLKLEGDS